MDETSEEESLDYGGPRKATGFILVSLFGWTDNQSGVSLVLLTCMGTPANC